MRIGEGNKWYLILKKVEIIKNSNNVCIMVEWNMNDRDEC
jgi:hypothetical protein